MGQVRHGNAMTTFAVRGAISVFCDGKAAGVDYDWRIRFGGYELLADYYLRTELTGINEVNLSES